jgi:hypothetical protein
LGTGSPLGPDRKPRWILSNFPGRFLSYTIEHKNLPEKEDSSGFRHFWSWQCGALARN